MNKCKYTTKVANLGFLSGVTTRLAVGQVLG